MCLDAARKVELALVADSQGHTIELVAPAADDSPVSRLLKKSGATPYHICLAAKVERGFDECRACFEEAGFAVLHEPEPAPLFGGKDVVFLYSRSLGLVELLIEPAGGAHHI